MTLTSDNNCCLYDKGTRSNFEFLIFFLEFEKINGYS